MNPTQSNIEYWIVTRDGYVPTLITSELMARDLARSGWTVVRVVKTEPLHP